MKLGLTGGIGCGKSTVSALFKEAGWQTIDTDSLVRELLEEDSNVQAHIREHWGDEVFTQDALIDRKAVAALVFSDKLELEWLENLLHPIVQERWKSSLEGAPELHWLVEIPLLFEKRLETYFDLTVCVHSLSNIVEARIANRGYSQSEILQRREQQMPLDEKVERADHVISNSGSFDFLKLQIKKLIEQTKG
jgi:dephospho-CoA kinase